MTGSKELDNILDGGFRVGGVSLIYGEAETGKTTLSMQCAVNCAKQGYKILFVDCDNTFFVRRLSQIAAKNLQKASEFIILIRPKNFDEQSFVIEKLIDYINEGFGLVIVDTITSLYRNKVSEHPRKTFELNRKMNRQMAWLVQVAKTQKISVLVTSQVRSVFIENDENVEPVATRVLKFWADTIVFLKPTEKIGTIKAVLEKTPKKLQKSFCQLVITEKGIRS
jgi:DNA repair protein RadB